MNFKVYFSSQIKKPNSIKVSASVWLHLGDVLLEGGKIDPTLVFRDDSSCQYEFKMVRNFVLGWTVPEKTILKVFVPFGARQHRLYIYKTVLTGRQMAQKLF